jgi:hypothetical protein
MWRLILGVLFVLVTVFMPKGMIGLPEQLRDLKRRFRPAAPPQPEPEPIRETSETK